MVLDGGDGTQVQHFLEVFIGHLVYPAAPFYANAAAMLKRYHPGIASQLLACYLAAKVISAAYQVHGC